MKHLKLILVLIVLLVFKVASADTVQQIEAIKKFSSKAYAIRLAKAIDKTASKHGVPKDILIAVLAQESMFRVEAFNKTTMDYGIAQINIKTIKAYQFDAHKLLTDLEYSVEAGAIVLKYFHKRYQAKESNWYCRYNSGTANSVAARSRCTKYASLVNRYRTETVTVAMEY